jgi:hypothetical protein
MPKLKMLKLWTACSASTICARLELLGVRPAISIALMISRCGYSTAAAGTIEPWMPAAGLPSIYGSLESDGLSNGGL